MELIFLTGCKKKNLRKYDNKEMHDNVIEYCLIFFLIQFFFF